MTIRTVVTHSAGETARLASRIGRLLEPGDVVVLAGELGSGKTVVARGLADGLGVEEPVVSPTFTLAREYLGRVRLVHVDVYRLERVQELLDLALDELGGADAVTVVEWGDAVSAYLPPDRLEIRLARGDANDDRLVTIEEVGPSWTARRAAIDEIGRPVA